jgi:hypothetical protein
MKLARSAASRLRIRSINVPLISADHLSEGDRAARCRTRKKRPASAGNRPPVGPASKSAPKGRAQSRRGIPIRLFAGAFPVEGAPNSRRPVWRIPEGAAERA